MLHIRPRGSGTLIELSDGDVERSELLRDCASHGHREITVPFSAAAVHAWLQNDVQVEPEVLLDVVQLALFLNADATHFAQVFCSLLPAGRAGRFGADGVRTRAAEALTQSNAFALDTIAAAHPAMQRHLAGGGDDPVPLMPLPTMLHGAACRLAASRSGGALAFTLRSYRWAAAAVPAMRSTPGLRHLRMAAPLCMPDVATDVTTTAPLLARLTQLTALEMHSACRQVVEAVVRSLGELPLLADLAIEHLDTSRGTGELFDLGSTLGALRTLTRLSLGVNVMTEELAVRTGPGLASLSALRVLHLREADCVGDAACTLAHQLPALRHIDVGTACLASDTPDRVPLRATQALRWWPAWLLHEAGLSAADATAVLQCVPTLESAAFALKGACSEELLLALAMGPPLTRLQLASNAPGAGLQLRALCPQVFSRFCAALHGLSHLELGGAGFDDACMAALTPALAACPHLAALHLTGGTLSRDAARTLCETLAEREGLTWLELGLGHAADVGCITQLRHLSVSAEGWDAGEACAFAEALAGLRGLTHVRVAGAMPDVGAAAVLRAVGAARALRSLHVHGATCEEAAAQAISDTLGALTALETLSMRGSRLTGAPVRELALQLRCWPRLACLDLASTQLGDGDVGVMTGALVGARLTTLNVADNTFSVAGAERFRAGLEPLMKHLRPVVVHPLIEPMLQRRGLMACGVFDGSPF